MYCLSFCFNPLRFFDQSGKGVGYFFWKILIFFDQLLKTGGVYILCKNDEILETVPTGQDKHLTGWLTLGVGVPYRNI